jgi:hypothetical protein
MIRKERADMGQSPSLASQASERSVLIETRLNAAFGGTHCTEEHQWTQGWRRSRQVAMLPSAKGDFEASQASSGNEQLKVYTAGVRLRIRAR